MDRKSSRRGESGDRHLFLKLKNRDWTFSLSAQSATWESGRPGSRSMLGVLAVEQRDNFCSGSQSPPSYTTTTSLMPNSRPFPPPPTLARRSSSSSSTSTLSSTTTPSTPSLYVTLSNPRDLYDVQLLTKELHDRAVETNSALAEGAKSDAAWCGDECKKRREVEIAAAVKWLKIRTG